MSSATMRAGNVSLRGGFGLIEAGTLQWSAGYTVASRWGMFAEGFGGGEAHTTMPARITGLSWTSPVMSNTTVTLQHGSAHGQRTDRESVANAADGFTKNKEARTGFNIQHTAGPLYLGAAYESTAVNKIANAAATTNAYGGAVAVPTAGLGSRTEKAWTVAANYDFGPAVVRGMMVERDNGAATYAKTSGKGVSVAVPVGALTLIASYGTIVVKSPTATTSDISGHQLTARYNLSNRTND